MYFEYIGGMYISENELDELVSMCKNGWGFYDALAKISENWTEEEFYQIGHIEEALKKEIERRIAESK